VSYIVAEKGSWELKEGLTFEAGLHTTDTKRKTKDALAGDQIEFTTHFEDEPAVLHTLNTKANADFTTSFAGQVTTTGFQIAQEIAGVTPHESATETIGWIAFKTETGKFGGKQFNIGFEEATHNVGVENKAYSITMVGHDEKPDIVVAVITAFGKDGAWARGSGLYSSTHQEVYAEEDQVGDKERWHVKEKFAWAAFDHNTDFRG